MNNIKKDHTKESWCADKQITDFVKSKKMSVNSLYIVCKLFVCRLFINRLYNGIMQIQTSSSPYRKDMWDSFCWIFMKRVLLQNLSSLLCLITYCKLL